jgi:mannose-6-phosphate isomerase-like protein (cupin superfamily)
VKIDKLSDMKLGWFVGDFHPSVFQTEAFEVAFKEYAAGETEPFHYQSTALEITLITSGKARMGSEFVSKGDIITIRPLESVDFEALSDVTLLAIKMPSIPSDKVLGNYE